ncbi:MAG: HAMP domain-containing protein [Acidobacteria bacterium]|nr:HAMP domain-containing protein [Acidobacteriota bacterium]
MRRACLYLPDGTLFASFARNPELACPRSRATAVHWTVIIGNAPVMSQGRDVGIVVVERDLAELQERIIVTALIAGGMLLVAGTVAAWLAHRLTRRVSTPITKLAMAAGNIGHEGQDRQPLLEIAAPPDEVGQLVDAFRAMVGRLLESNETLRNEIEERRKVETEREALLERERHTSRLKDEFLAAVSHELRTPLNAILGWVQMLGATELDAETTAKAIASIGRNARAQTRVIEDLVDVSRIVTGKLHLRMEPVDLRGVVDGALEVIRPVAVAKRITVDVQVPDEICLVNGDQDRLRQVIWNLLSNAVKFTPAEGRVSVALRSVGGLYEIAVADTGLGIKPEFLPYVFDRFRQGDGSMTREHGGLGLGLSIVKELTEVHGGTVAVTSEGEGQGATFFVLLGAMDSVTVAS